MQCLLKRLKPRQDEILRVVAERGQFPGMRCAGVQSVPAFRKWLEEVTGDESFGLYPSNPKSLRSNYWTLRKRAEQTFLQILANLEAIADKQSENEQLEKEIKVLQWKIMEARRQGAPASELKLCEI